MSSFKEHCSECKEKLGREWYVVHRWLDHYAGGGKDGRPFDPNHRRHRHHLSGIEEVRHKWGDEAAEAAKLHIESDMGFVPTEDWWLTEIVNGLIIPSKYMINNKMPK